MTSSQGLIFLEDEDQRPFAATASETDIVNCFRLNLGRYPGRAEWAGHVTRVGELLSHVVPIYVDSTEYKRLRTSSKGARSVELNGYTFFASAEDLAVGGHVLAHREYEPEVASIFARKLRPGMRLLDIGANIGYYTFLAASLVGQSGKVWAIEPNSNNVAFLLAGRARNGFDHIEIIQAAASDRWEVLSLETSCSNGAARPSAGMVPADFVNPVMALPLAACLPADEPLDVIKIDVEGAEGRALRGMLALIERYRPAIFSEFTPSALPSMSGMSPREYLELFSSRNYLLNVLERAGPRAMTVDALLEHAARVAGDSHLDLLVEPLP
jgi:FkbM family methyltransferase